MRKTLKLVKKVLLIGVLMIAACAARLHAQTYPVQVSTQIAPPFSPYLSDYSAADAQRFMVNFLLKDPTLPEYRCKLRLTIEGVGITIRTKQSFVPQPLVLPGGGIPLQVYGEELEEYFNPNNLDFAGFSKAQYTKGAKLPDGVYRFTVEVLDYNRGTVVSNKGTAVAFIILNDPPLLNMPRTDTKVRVLDPTNIPLTWTPRHTGSPNAAFTTEYIFRLVEIWPVTRNPYDAFLSQQPLYEITTNATQIVYGPAEPALIPGRKYAWQVQAKDVEGRDLFKNQGKSEVFVFQFGDALGAPEGLYLQTANPTSLVVRWEQNVAGTDAVKYRVRYRPHKGRAHDNWYEEESEEQWRALSQLQPETEYEVQVRAEQSVQVSEYGPVKVFKTALPGANEFVCKSDVSPPPAPTTNAPAVRLGINDTIHAGGYDVLVRELSENNNGVYTGSGMAIVPWFMSAKVRVTFKKINVNEQHWLTSGEIKSVWNPDSKFLLTPDKKPDPTTRPTNGEVPVTVAETETLIEIDGAVIVDVSKNEDGDIEVNTSDGETKTLEKGKSYSIVDAAGNGYIVDKEGNVAKTTAQEARDAAGRGDRNYTIALRFEKGLAVFGFDEKKYDALASNYQQLEGGQYIPWKAVTSSRQDVVNAVLEGTDIDPKKVRFEVNGSPATHSGFSGGVSTVNVPGKAEGTVEELLAVYAPSDTGKVNVLGKVNLTSYDQISRNLVIIPVNNAKLPGDLSDVTLSRELTKIYGQAVADWKVSIAPNPLKVTLDEYFDDGGSGLLSNYTADMKKVINAFGTLQEKTYYLFLVEKPRSGTSALGYMPRSKQAGFIFSDNLTSANAISTIAHELGHGAFNLKHIFSEYSISKGATDNLMDYNNGTALYKYQWDRVHDPQNVVALFEDDEDGESIAMASLACINSEVTAKLKGSVFYDPLGNTIDIGANVPYAFFTQQEEDASLRGKLSAFKVGEVMYSVYYYTKNLRFAGYAPAGRKFANYEEFKKVMYAGHAGTVASAQEIRISESGEYSIWQNGQSIGSGKLADCKCSGLPNSKPQVDGKEGGTIEDFYTYHKGNGAIDQAILLRVKNLMLKMGDDFYKKYMPGAEEVALTNENLLAMEKSLQHFIDLQNSFFGETSFAAFEKLVAFLKLCYEDYKKQLADKETHDIVPRCIWKDLDLTPALYYGPADLAFSAGIVDGAWTAIVGIVDLLNFVDCWTPVSLRFWFDDDCGNTRDKTIDFFKAMGGIVSGEGKKLDAFKSTVSTQFHEYIGSLSGFGPEERHQQGKLVFDIGSLFIGAGEANLAAKGAAITERTAVLMEKVAVMMSKIKVPAVIKMIPTKLSKAAASTAFVLAMSTGTVTAELATVVPKAANVMEYVIGLSDNAATTAAKVAEATAAAEKEVVMIEAAIKAAEASEKAAITIVDKAGKITELGSGVVVATEVGNYVILSIKVGQESIQHVKAIEQTTAAVILLGAFAGKPGEEPKPACTFCTQPAACACFEGLAARYTSYATTIKEICELNPVNGLAICEKLAQASFTQAFLADLKMTTSDVHHISKFKNSLSVNLIDAWDLINTYEQPLRRANMPLLNQVVSQQDNTALLQKLGGLNGLGSIISKNKRAPYKGCANCTGFTYLRYIDQYLVDVEDFVNRYSNRQLPGFEDVVGSSGMKNGSVSQVEGTAFMLRVLHNNTVLQGQIVGFEVTVEAINDEGIPNTRYADIYKAGDVIVECKSWSANGLSFSHFVRGEGSYGQFLTYLRASSSFSGFEYWFDGWKPGINPGVVKEKFQALYNAKRPEIWGIIQNKPLILSRIGNPADEAAFQRVINDLTSNLYSFIKVK